MNCLRANFLLLLLAILAGCTHPIVLPTETPGAMSALPQLELSIDRVDVRADRALIVGRVSPAEALVVVADRDAEVDASGKFTATVGLAMGMNFIPVVAWWRDQQRTEIVQARRMAATEGEMATLGGVEFSLVSAVLTDTVGTEPLVAHARGQFLVLEISVRNNRREPVTLWDEDFVLQDEENRSYYVSTEGVFAWRSAAGENMHFRRLSPGTETRHVLVFDVPHHVPGGMVLRAYNTVESWAAEMAVLERVEQ